MDKTLLQTPPPPSPTNTIYINIYIISIRLNQFRAFTKICKQVWKEKWRKSNGPTTKNIVCLPSHPSIIYKQT